MTTIWRPASHEIDPLQEAVLNAARATILPLAAISSPAPSGQGVRELQLADGRHLQMTLTAQQASQETRNGRVVVIYGFSGNAVVDRAGYRITGQATLDVATRAFLDVGCRLVPVGAVSV